MIETRGLETKSSGLAIFMSFFWPGLGHVYLGRVIRGVVMMLALTLPLYGITAMSLYALFDHAKSQAAWYESKAEAETRAKYSDIAAERQEAQSSLPDLEQIVKSETRRGRQFLRFAYTCTLISLAWWILGMVLTQRACEKINRMTFERAQQGGRG